MRFLKLQAQSMFSRQKENVKYEECEQKFCRKSSAVPFGNAKPKLSIISKHPFDSYFRITHLHVTFFHLGRQL